MVVRDYLVKNFKMDDTHFKTMGLGKQEEGDASQDGRLEILIYPAGSAATEAANSSASLPRKSQSR